MRTFTQKLALLLLTLWCGIGVSVQASEVVIGDESSTSTSTYYPTYSYYNYSYNQQIFTADEIGGAGTISSISLWLSTTTGNDITRSIEIYMVEVSKSSFASTSDWEALSAENLVYQGQVTFPSTEEKVTFTLDESFSYGGSDNLLIAFRDVTGSYEGSYGGGTRAKVSPVEGGAYLAMYVYRDSPGAFDIAAPGASGTRSASRDVIALDITSGGGSTCGKPETCDITGITTDGATVNFAGGSGTYNVEIKGGAYADWTFADKNTTNTSYTFTDLAPNTSYQVRVQSVCEGDDSGYKTASFTTLIGLPFAENFNATSKPDGWSIMTGQLHADGSATLTSGYGWSFATGNGVFDNHAKSNIYSTGCYKWLILPEILIPAMEEGDLGYQMTFDIALTQYNGTNTQVTPNGQSDDRFIVLASLDGGANWNILREWNNAGSEYVYDNIAYSAEGEEVVLDISAYAGYPVILAFYGESTVSNGDNNFHIDNLLIDRIPTCLKPTDIHEVEGSVTKTSIQLDWTANTAELAWVLQYKESGEEDWLAADVTEKPYTLSGLQAFTSYDIRVAAACSDEDHSDYSNAISVKTAAGVPFTQSFNTTALPGEWKRYEVFREQQSEGDPMVSTTAGWKVAALNGVFSANRHLVLNVTGADCKYWIVSPTIVMEEDYQLTFDLALTTAAGNTPTAVTPGEQKTAKFMALISQDGGDTWSDLGIWAYDQATTFDGISPDGKLVKFDLSAYNGRSIQIAFYGESKDTIGQVSNNLHIANFQIAPIPDCEKANSLTITGITGSSATASWEADEAGTWQYGYVVKPEGDFTPTDEQFSEPTANTQIDLANLEETTTYIFFLRRACENSTSEILYKEFTTLQTPAALPYSADFEENNGGWLLFNGTQTNQWAWGEATNNGGTHALYISNDNGTSNTYDNEETSVVFASKTFYFDETGTYSFSFDWKGAGEANYDYLRVALVPAAAEFTPGTIPSGYSYSALPEGWIALDGGAQLNAKSEWQHQSFDYAIDQIGYYKVVLVWTNDYMMGDDPSAAIDNFHIARLNCARPTGLAVSEIENEGATIVWDTNQDGFAWVYAVAPAAEGEPADDAFLPIDANSIALEGLAINTNYKFYLRTQCATEVFSESEAIAFKTLNPYQITVNDGTATNSYVPIYGTWVDDYTKSQFIIPAASLEALMWDTITTLTFYTSAPVDSWGDALFEAYMAPTENTTLSSLAAWTSLTKVMDAAALSVVDEQMVVELTTPYVYTGGNLLIGFNQTVSGTYKSASWLGVSAASGASYGGYGSSVSAQSFLPKVSFDIIPGQAPACSAPVGLHAVDSLIATNSAVLTWTPQSAEPDFVLRYKESEAADWADTIFVMGKDSFLLEGLNPATIYEAQVAAWCDATDPEAIGEFGSSAIFATECVAVADINEDFEGSLLCWSAIQEVSGGYYYPAIVNSADLATSGTKALYFRSYSYGTPVDQYVILPELISLDNKRIKFNVRKESASDEDTYAIVGVMTDPADSTSFEALDYLLVDAIEYSQRIVFLNTYAGAGKYVAIKMPAVSTSNYAKLLIDDVVVEDIPACMDPQGIHAIADSITSSSALLAWTPLGTESDWLVRYRINGAADWADTIHATNDTLLIEGLAAVTTYEVQVAAWCDPADDEAVSPFSASGYFTTACGIISTFPYAENFDELPLASTYTPSARTLPLCWSAINTCTNSSYKYYPTAYYYSYTDYSNSQPNSLRFYSYYSSSTDYDPQDQYAILPQMDGISGLRMRFNARRSSSYSSSGDSIIVGIMTDPEDISTFVAIQTIKPAGATYEPFEVRFNTYAGEGQYIALKLEAANASNTSRGLYLDDILVDELPSCFEPEGLAVFDIEEHSAKFTWTVEEGESYVYAFALASAGEPAEDAFADATDSMQISGLVDNKDYILYLRKNCAGNYSPSISAAFHTLMAPATAPYADDFEDGNNWMFINGNLSNAWVYGEAAHNGEGTHAIYISNDGGASNAYTVNSAVVVYAVKSFNLADGVYSFKYDWKANGESTYDYLRVALIPDSIELVATTSLPSGLSTTAFPAAWHAIALDGESAMNGVTSWQTFQSSEIAISAGAYKVVFLWRDDTSTGTQQPAAIDNFSISKITCLPVSELAVSGITSSSATISWAAPEGQDAWQLAYSADPNFDIAEATLFDVASTTYALADLLTDTLYNVYVRANCGSEDGVSVWSQISFRTAKACQTPDNLAAADITINSASISWNTYGQAGFNLRYIQGNDTVDVPSVESPYALTDLDDATDYYVQVQVSCDENWSEALHFVTLQAPATLPYANDFESKNGWSFINGSYTNAWVYGTAAHNGEGTHALYISNNGGAANAYSVSSPAAVYATKLFQFEDGVYNFKYDWKAYGENNYDLLCVALVPDSLELSASATGMFSLPADWTTLHNGIKLNLSSSWATVSFDLAVEAGLYKVVLLWRDDTSGGSQTPAAVDNFFIKKLTCLKPTNLNTSDVLAHSAKLTWSAGEEGQSAWQIALDTIAAFNPDTLSNLIDVTDTSYIFTGLKPAKRYYAYVRANCGEDGTSDWSTVKSFWTTIACPAPTGLAAVLTPGNGSIATLNWNAGEAQAWQIEYSLNSDLSDSIAIVVSEPTINLTGLTAEETYYARVKADCGELDGESTYSTIISFKPTDAYELLLNDGTTTNSYVPIYGSYVDNATQRSQFVLPAAQLESLEWDSITTLTFYASNANVSWGAATFKAYVAEVEEATLDAEVDWASMTKVMNEASLSIVDNQMVVNFSEPYQYQGGNLLIGIKTEAIGQWASASWYGVYASGASIGGYGTGSNMVQRNFLPKLLINYVPGVAPACLAPKNLAVSAVTDESATFSWKAVEDAEYEYALVEGAAEPVAFLLADENPLVISNLAESTGYTFYLRRACGVDGYSEVISVPFTTDIHIDAVPFVEDFEADNHWKFVNDAQPNAWVIGNATAKDGANALYISNGNGNSYTHDDAPSVSYATILLSFAEDGEYTFEFDWKANGEAFEGELVDYLRVVLVSASATLVAGDATLPSGYTALDNGGLQGATEWLHHSCNAQVEAGQYKLVFAWFNDDADGEDAPAAIDNISIQEKTAPTGLENGNAGIFNNGKAIKFIRDEKVYIFINGTVYNITGQKVELR